MKRFKPNIHSLISQLRSYEVLISSFIVIATVIVLVITLLIPNFQKARKIFSEHQNLAKKLVAIKKKDEELSKINYQLFKDTLPKIILVLPYQKDFVSLFTRFDQLQSKTGVTILRTDFQLGVISTTSANIAKQEMKGTFFIPMSVEVVGTQPQIEQFIDSLSDVTGRLITISEIQWQFREDQSITAAINGKAYFTPLPVSLGTLETTLPQFNKSQQSLFDKVSQNSDLDIPFVETDTIPTGKKNLFE